MGLRCDQMSLKHPLIYLANRAFRAKPGHPCASIQHGVTEIYLPLLKQMMFHPRIGKVRGFVLPFHVSPPTLT
jgi:hypothetical protein